MLQGISKFSCCLCGTVFTVQEATEKLVCGHHELNQFAGVLDAHFDTGDRRRVQLPTFSEIPLVIGMTPLFRSPRLEMMLNVRQVWLKDEGRGATGSLKDRASAAVVQWAIETLGKQCTVATASTGNAAVSLAAVCAASDVRCVVFVPSGIPRGKLAQLEAFGCEVRLVDGGYDAAFGLCVETCRLHDDWINRNTAMNPITILGKKSAILEVAHSMKEMPSVIFVPVGDGNIISSVHAALLDLQHCKMIQNMPRIIGAQARGSSVCAQAHQRFAELSDLRTAIDSGTQWWDSTGSTVCDSIAANPPRDLYRAVRSVRDTEGDFITCSDAEILAAQKILGNKAGVFVEPSAAVTLAAALKMQLKKSDSVLLLLTGNGLKALSH